MIKVGEKAPDFALPSNLEEGGKPGKKVSLADYKGKNVVLAFYPLDFSPVCTQESVCFVNDFARFEGLNAQVLGISVDSAWAHKAFAEKLGIKFPLLADFNPKGDVGRKYGVYLEDKGIQSRTTVIVDKTGTVRWVKANEIPVVPDTQEMLAELKKLG
ncbi:MAG TPA: redoxin domain-containing protein [Myxococcales bacterium]|nr:redoxin domain-containing protein [Myxococcales bacterium]